MDIDLASLRPAPPDRLPAIAEQLRQHLIASVATHGGHLGPNLGVVELTIAIHRNFDSPNDVVLWDTGHQAYIHKMVTARASRFSSLRERGGLSGYPNRAESPHDWIENSHAGTSLSYASGIRRGLDGRGEARRHVVCVIGDGAICTGMALEALNDIGDHRLGVIIVLNDNGRSYAPTTGALAQHFSALRARGGGSSFFESLRVQYLGPVDGHDIAAMGEAFSAARAAVALGPVVVHVVTVKGKGYAPAESDRVDHLHGVGPFDPATGRARASISPRVVASSVVGSCVVGLADADEELAVIVAAMGSASGFDEFSLRHPRRFHDVGIAEQHAVTLAAGLAMVGARPIVGIHATFLHRAIDQVLLDVGLHNLPVVFLCDRAGVTGADGPSHNGVFDLSLLRTVPGLAIATPASADELSALIRYALTRSGPTCIRYCRDLPREHPLGTSASLEENIDGWQMGSAARGVAVVACGDVLQLGVEVAAALRASGTPASITNARWIAPLDGRIGALANEHKLVVTIEDHGIEGGLGSAVLGHLASTHPSVRVMRFGVPHRFLPHGNARELRKEIGLTVEAILPKVLREWSAVCAGTQLPTRWTVSSDDGLEAAQQDRA